MKKKSYSLIFVCALSILLCACSSALPSLPEMPDTSSSAQTPGAQISESSVDVGEVPEASVALPNQIVVRIENAEPDYYYDSQTEDEVDHLILTFLAEKPVVAIEGNDAASDRINEFFEKMNEEIVTGDDFGVGTMKYPGRENMIAAAFDNYQVHIDYNLDIKLDFAFSHTLEVVRCDSSVISFVFTDYTYDGNGTGKLVRYAYSFDTVTGILLTDGLFDSADSILSLLEEAGSSIDTDSQNPLDMGNWYVGTEGVVFLVSNVALGESGDTVTIPLSVAGTVFENSYTYTGFPSSGQMSAVSDAENMGKPIEDIVVYQSEGAVSYLDINGTVSNVRVSAVQYSDIDSKFYLKSVLWAANYLDDCFLQICSDIPDGMPNLMIEFETDGNSVQLLLSESGENGAPILVDSSINAVG